MVDNVIRTSRGPRNTPMVNYRPDDSVLYARRVVGITDVRPARPVVTESSAVLVAAPQAVVKPLPQPVATPRMVDVVTPVAKRTIADELAEAIAEPVTTSGFALAGFDGTVAAFDRAAMATESLSIGAEKVWNSFAGRADMFRYGIAAVVAMVVLAVTGYVSIDTWVTNSEVKQAVASQQETAASGVVLGEGQDETEVATSTVDNYHVAPDLPRVLMIEKLNVRARVLPMSVNADGAMQAPVNIFDSGWYGASAKPGQQGAAVIDAHASGATREGLFAYLDTLAIGDQLSIERGDGQKLTYEVVHTETVALDSIDMKKLLTPYGAEVEGLNLITCTGKWLPDQKTYDHRVTVYTKRVS